MTDIKLVSEIFSNQNEVKENIQLMFQPSDLCLLFEVEFQVYSSDRVLPSPIHSVLLSTCTFVRLSDVCYPKLTSKYFVDFFSTPV